MDTLKRIFMNVRSKPQAAVVENHPNFWMYHQ